MRSTWRSGSVTQTMSSITRTRAAQYTSIAFGLRCKQAGVRPSMGSVADCYDNAMCESFFATLIAQDASRFSWTFGVGSESTS
jgi:transposase InsO family protein